MSEAICSSKSSFCDCITSSNFVNKDQDFPRTDGTFQLIQCNFCSVGKTPQIGQFSLFLLPHAKKRLIVVFSKLRKQEFDWTEETTLFTPSCSTVFLLTFEGVGSELKVWEKLMELVCPQVTEESARLEVDLLPTDEVWRSGLGLCSLAFSAVMDTSNTFYVLAIPDNKRSESEAFFNRNSFFAIKWVFCPVSEEYISHFCPQSSEKLFHHFGALISHKLTETYSKGDCPHQFQQQSRQWSKLTNFDSFRMKKNKTDGRRNTEIEIGWS